MIRNITIALLAAIGLPTLCTQPAMAANSADLTFFHRKATGHSVKLIETNGAWLASPTIDLGSASLMFSHWQSADANVRQDMAILATSLSRSVDAAVEAECWRNGARPFRAEVGLDWHNQKTGLGLALPLQANDSIKVGIRQNLAPGCTAFLRLAEKNTPLYGVSVSKKGWSLEPAYGGGTTQIFVSKWMGKMLPELRLKFSPRENVVGLGFLIVK